MPKMPKAIDVYLEKRKARQYVGRLSKQGRSFVFKYDERYRGSASPIALGPDLPLRQARHSSLKLFPSFEDRLPSKENPAYGEYCRSVGVSPSESDPFVLLSALGRKGPSSFVLAGAFEEGFSAKGLKQFRRDLKLSMREFADLFDISKTAVYRIENSRATGKQILKAISNYHKFPNLALDKIRQTGHKITAQKRRWAKEFFQKKSRANNWPPASVGQAGGSLKGTVMRDSTHAPAVRAEGLIEQPPFAVRPEDVQKCSPQQAVELCRRLALLECSNSGIPQNGVHISSNISAKDGGQDGLAEWLDGPERTDYFPSRYNCFQIKTGSLSSAQCKKEILDKSGRLKPALQKAIERKGAYILFSTQPVAGIHKNAREEALKEALREKGHNLTVKFYDANIISNWINSFPSLAVWLLTEVCERHIRPWRSWADWSREEPDFKSEFMFHPALYQKLKSIREILSAPKGAVHLTGASGLGKTRLALEALRPEKALSVKSALTGYKASASKSRGANARDLTASKSETQKNDKTEPAVLNEMGALSSPVDSANGPPLEKDLSPLALYSSAKELTDFNLRQLEPFRAILIIDDCSLEEALRFHKISAQPDSKLSLLTLGHEEKQKAEGNFKFLSQREVFVIELKPDEEIVKKMLAESQDIKNKCFSPIALKCAQGFPLMASLLKRLSPDDLLKSDISILRDKMLWGGDTLDPDEKREAKKVIKACSLFNSICVDDEGGRSIIFSIPPLRKSVEAKYIAKKICELDYNEFYKRIQFFKKRQIIQQIGGFIQVRPKPLAVWLANEWLAETPKKSIAPWLFSPSAPSGALKSPLDQAVSKKSQEDSYGADSARDQKPDKELAQQKLGEESAQQKTDKESAQQKPDKESAQQKPDKELAQQKLGEESAQQKTDKESAQQKPDKESAQQKPDEESAQQKPDKELAQQKPDEELAQPKLDEELAQQKPDEESAQQKTEEFILNSLRESFCEQLSYLEGCPEAKELAHRLLEEGGVFDSAKTLNTEWASRCFLCLAEIDPATALQTLKRIFKDKTAEELKQSFPEDSSPSLASFGLPQGWTNIVGALQKLAVKKELYPDSARLLLKFAEAEDPQEHLSHSARGVFISHFQLFLSGTEAGPEEKFKIIEEIKNSSSAGQKDAALRAGNKTSNIKASQPSIRQKDVALQALNTALQRDGFISSSDIMEIKTGKTFEDYQPKTESEARDYFKKALKYLIHFATKESDPQSKARRFATKESAPDIRDKARRVIASRLGFLLNQNLYDEAEKAIKAVLADNPYWPSAFNSLLSFQCYSKNIKLEQKLKIKKMLQLLQPENDLDNRLRFYISDCPESYIENERDYQEKFKRLLEDFKNQLENEPKKIASSLKILFHGEQNNVLFFAKELAESFYPPTGKPAKGNLDGAKIKPAKRKSSKPDQDKSSKPDQDKSSKPDQDKNLNQHKALERFINILLKSIAQWRAEEGFNPWFLTGFFWGLNERDLKMSRLILDKMADDPIWQNEQDDSAFCLRNFLLWAYRRMPLQDQDIDRLLAVIDKIDLSYGALGALNCQFVSLAKMRDFAQTLAEKGGEPSWSAFKLLHSYYKSQTETENKSKLTASFFDLLTRDNLLLYQGKYSVIDGLYYREAVRQILSSDYAKRFSKIFVSQILSIKKSLHDLRIDLSYIRACLRDILKKYPDIVLSELVSAGNEQNVNSLFRKGAFSRGYHSGTGSLLSVVAEAKLKEWCLKAPGKIPAVLARNIDLLEDSSWSNSWSNSWSSFAKFLFDNYGDKDNFIEALSLCLISFSGRRRSDYFKRLKRAVEELRDHKHKKIRDFAENELSYLEERVNQEERREKERGL